MLVISAMWEAEIRRIKVLSQSQPKHSQDLNLRSKGKGSWAWWHVPIIPP
jgi:hypothetical protein